MPNEEEAQNSRNNVRTDQGSAGQSSRPSRRPSNVSTSAAQQANVPSPRRSARLAGGNPASPGLLNSPQRTRTPRDRPGHQSPVVSAGASRSPLTAETSGPQPSQDSLADQAASQSSRAPDEPPQQSRAQAMYTPRPSSSLRPDRRTTSAQSDNAAGSTQQTYREPTVEDADAQSDDSDPTPRASQAGRSSAAASTSEASENTPVGETTTPAAAGSTEAAASADSRHGFIPIARDVDSDVSMPDRSASGSRVPSDANRFSPGAASTASANGFRAVSPRELSAGRATFKYRNGATACSIVGYQPWGHGSRLLIKADNGSPHYLLCRSSHWGVGALQEYQSYSRSVKIEVDDFSSLRDKCHDDISIGAVASLFTTNNPTENARVPWANEPIKLVLISFNHGVSERWYTHAALERRWPQFNSDLAEYLGYNVGAMATPTPTPSTGPGNSHPDRPQGPEQSGNPDAAARTANGGSNEQTTERVLEMMNQMQTMMANLTVRMHRLEGSMNARRASARGMSDDDLFALYALNRVMRDERPNEPECPVCRSSFDDGTTTPWTFTNCSHVACEECTRTLIDQDRENARCPLCRQSLMRQ